ncbi:MAG: hypothetical protein Kow0029_01320 [Candidatus Rifleibacteriota bacterium]
MNKLFKLFTVLMVVLGSMSQAASADPFSLSILSASGFTSDFGNPVDTYEDVDEITGIGPRPVGPVPLVRNVDVNAFHLPVKAATGKAFIDKINLTGGRILYNPGFSIFLKHYMYIEAGGFDKYGKWFSRSILSGFPVNYDPKNDPHVIEFFLCLKGGWDYIPPFSYDPDAKSCDVNRDLCDYPPCIKEEKEDGDEDGDGIPNEVKVEEEHHQPTNNVYKDLASVVYGKVIKGAKVEKNSSGMVFKMIFKDRTPPTIEGCVDGKFPELGKDKPATTGDWYKIEGLKIKDNDSHKIGTCICFGKIDLFPSSSWLDSEKWEKEEPFREFDVSKDVDYVILPNICYGAMRYSVFAWDSHGLLNPGDPMIENDKPENCYGLQRPPAGSENLGRDPAEAKPWPPELTLTFADSSDITSIDGSKINPDDRRGEGILNITDNDLPNVVIKIWSVKDKSAVFFPPIMEPDKLPILASSDYKKDAPEIEGITKNTKDYSDFISLDIGGGAVYTRNLIDKDKNLYFKIIDIKPSPVMDPAEVGELERFKNPSGEEDDNFIRKNFRLEDYSESDTTTEGVPVVGDPETFGARNGFGGEVVAVLEKPLQEDVEYFVSVWADDNVKWSTKDESGKLLDKIISIPTGIKAGEFSLSVPNQYPTAFYKQPLDPSSSVSRPIKVVFREPTRTGGTKDEKFYLDNKFPFIEVTASDFVGNTRKIKLYLRVSNENPNIRILERQHEKKR